MKIRPVLVVAVALFTACGDLTLPQPDNPSLDLTSSMEDRYIVVFQDLPNQTVNPHAIAQGLGITPDFVYTSAVRGFAARLTPAQVSRLQNDATVSILERDGIVTKADTVSPVPSWGLDRVDQQNLPLDNTFIFNTSGQGVEFWGIDTGIRSTHVDFAGRFAPGVTYVFDGLGTEDCDGHGTHTASTAAGATYGVARDMIVRPVRVLSCAGTGSYAQVIAGVDYVTANATLPAVANMSLSGPVSATLNAAVAASVAAGITYAVAAGNDYSFDACLLSPASEPSVLTVGATNINDTRAGFSNIGTCLDLFAPGVGITAAWATNNTATNTINGTSMAAPHVAGVAGLYLEQNPTHTPAQVAAALVGNATPGVVGNPGNGSPNLLLYSGFIAPPGNQAPVASFTWSCNVLDCSFDGTGSSDDGGIVQYEWTDASGTVLGTGATLAVTFPAPGAQDITLTVTDGPGLTGSSTQLVTYGPVNQPPAASFSVTCDANLTCTFDGTTSTDDVGIVQYEWIGPGGGVLATGDTWVNTFFQPATVQFSLRVTDAGGLTDTDTQQVVIAPSVGNQPPVAAFTFTCSGLDCAFDGSGSSDDAGVVAYDWAEAGLGALGTGSTLNYTFPGAGTYSVTLTVADAAGLTDTDTQSVTVAPANQAPTASFTYSCTGLSCAFDGTGSTDDVGIVAYAWTDAGGTVLGTGSTLNYTFGSAGSFDITLTVTDGGGLTGAQTQTVTVSPVNQPPTASFSYTCTGLSCSFDGTGSTDDGGVTGYVWTDAAGTTLGSASTLNFTFAAAGTYDITLTVSDVAGLTDSQTQSITVSTVNQPPVAMFTTSCTTGLLCTFDGTSSTDDGGVVLYEWFGPGGGLLATGAQWVNQFSGQATLPFSLRVTDAGGLTNTVTQQVTIAPPTGNQPPVASFTASCNGLTCQLDGSGSSDDVQVVGYEWTDASGTVLGSASTLTITFPSAGSYDITLTVTDGGGLTGAQTQTLTVGVVNAPPVASFTVSCDAGLICTFDGTGSTDDTGIVQYEWIGPGGGVLATGSTWVQSFYQPATVQFSLRVTDGGGLQDTQTQQVVISPGSE